MSKIINGFNELSSNLLVEELKIFKFLNEKNINKLFLNKYKGKVENIINKVSGNNNFNTDIEKSIFDLLSKKKQVNISKDKIIIEIIKKVHNNFFDNDKNTDISYKIIDKVYFHYFDKKNLTYCQKSDCIYEKIIVDIKDLLEKIKIKDLESIDYLKEVFSNKTNLIIEKVIKDLINKNILKMDLTNDLLFILIIIYIDSLNIYKLNKELKYILLSQFILFKRNSQNKKFFPSYKNTLSFKYIKSKKESYNKKHKNYIMLDKKNKKIKKDLKINNGKVLKNENKFKDLNQKLIDEVSLRKENINKKEKSSQIIYDLNKKIDKLTDNLLKLKKISFKKPRVKKRIDALENKIYLKKQRLYENVKKLKNTEGIISKKNKKINNIKLRIEDIKNELNELSNKNVFLNERLLKTVKRKKYIALKSKREIQEIWNQKYKIKNDGLKNIVIFDYDEIIYIERLLIELNLYKIYIKKDKLINRYLDKTIIIDYKTKYNEIIIENIFLKRQ